MDVKEVLADLLAEQAALDAVMVTLADEQWALDTPSPRWSVADQIGHLTYFDNTAAMAISDPDAFTASLAPTIGAMTGGPEAADDYLLGEYRAMSATELLAAWRTNRQVLATAAEGLANEDRVIWYGPSMGSKSFLTARLMEVWAHGQDILDTVGASREATDRLKHIAQLGFITRGWTYINRKLDVPEAPVRVTLQAPSGDTWTFGEADAADSVTGLAEDFCLVVTQRRHVDDTALQIVGDAARDWMTKAQAFAGEATDGPGVGA